MEQLQYNLLFRWFVGLNMDEPVWVATVFSKNRERLLEGEIASLFFAGVLKQARIQSKSGEAETDRGSIRLVENSGNAA
jgi:transposase